MKSMSSTLHFFCGKMAAGKTTLAKAVAAEEGAVLIGWDLWLQRLFPVEITTFEDFLRCSGRLKNAMAPHVAEVLASGLSVALDFPANTPAARAWVRSIFEQAGCEHVLHFLDVPDSRCLTQLSKRNHERPEGSVPMTVEEYHQITALFVPPQESEGFVVKTHRD